mmetsp:Transcript_56089/g.89272  ORF Transcript_56089/g.89272 Transcript_56089/m.89272 type:complete len:220 (+) Transcript_56089:52-711(+)
MFTFGKKHKYTAYHDKHKDHTYTINAAGDEYDDDETDSFLFDNLADVPTDDPMHNDVDERSDDQTISSQPTDSKNWPPMWPKKARARDTKSSASPSTPTTTVPSSEKKPRYSSTVNFPDPELDEDDDQHERKQMKIDAMHRKQEEEQAAFKQMIEEKKKALKKKNNFMNKILNAFKRNKTSKGGQKKGKYNNPGQVDGEQCETPLTLTDNDYSDADVRE